MNITEINNFKLIFRKVQDSKIIRLMTISTVTFVIFNSIGKCLWDCICFSLEILANTKSLFNPPSEIEDVLGNLVVC